jgi:hypothetical protein
MTTSGWILTNQLVYNKHRNDHFGPTAYGYDNSTGQYTEMVVSTVTNREERILASTVPCWCRLLTPFDDETTYTNLVSSALNDLQPDITLSNITEERVSGGIQVGSDVLVTTDDLEFDRMGGTYKVMLSNNNINTSTVSNQDVSYDVYAKINTIVVTYPVIDLSGPIVKLQSTILETMDVNDNEGVTISKNDVTVDDSSTYTVHVEYQFQKLDSGIQSDYTVILTTTNETILATDTVGTYTIRYHAVDSSGNISNNISRDIRIVDTSPPSIQLRSGIPLDLDVDTNGLSEFLTVSKDDVLIQDLFDENVTLKIFVDDIIVTDSTTISSTEPKNVEIIYVAIDRFNNESTLSRHIQVKDTVPPIISWKAGVSDQVDIQITSAALHVVTTDDIVSNESSVVITLFIDGTEQEGSTSVTLQSTSVREFVVKYHVTDVSLNTSEITRTVRFIDTIFPGVTINPIPNVELGNTYLVTDTNISVVEDADYSIKYFVDGSKVSNNYELTSSTPRDVLVEYDVIDTGNNKTSVSQTVHFRDTTSPAISFVESYSTTYPSGTDVELQSTDLIMSDLSSPLTVYVIVDGGERRSTPYTITSELEEVKDIKYIVSDPSGNESELSITITFEFSVDQRRQILIDTPDYLYNTGIVSFIMKSNYEACMNYSDTLYSFYGTSAKYIMIKFDEQFKDVDFYEKIDSTLLEIVSIQTNGYEISVARNTGFSENESLTEYLGLTNNYTFLVADENYRYVDVTNKRSKVTYEEYTGYPAENVSIKYTAKLSSFYSRNRGDDFYFSFSGDAVSVDEDTETTISSIDGIFKNIGTTVIFEDLPVSINPYNGTTDDPPNFMPLVVGKLSNTIYKFKNTKGSRLYVGPESSDVKFRFVTTIPVTYEPISPLPGTFDLLLVTKMEIANNKFKLASEDLTAIVSVGDVVILQDIPDSEPIDTRPYDETYDEPPNGVELTVTSINSTYKMVFLSNPNKSKEFIITTEFQMKATIR